MLDVGDFFFKGLVGVGADYLTADFFFFFFDELNIGTGCWMLENFF
jgi:hypothetical protein